MCGSDVFFEKIKKNITDKLQSIPGKTKSDKFFYFENNFDSQFLSLKKLIEKVQIMVGKFIKKTSNPVFFGEYVLFLIIQNALISYQLSGKGENYWEEFSVFLSNYIDQNDSFSKYFCISKPLKNIDNDEFRNDNIEFWETFLSQCKNNRRLISMKLKRILKSLDLTSNMSESFFWYYKNMVDLTNIIANTMNQKNDAKTVVFSVKMFSYGARVFFNQNIEFPSEIQIPIDSRLLSFYAKIIKKDETEIKKKEVFEFYKQLAIFLKIPPLHLDALLRLKS